MKFSIVTAVYNRKHTVGQAVKSLHGQIYQDYEHIIQDGGSTDGTLETLKSLADSRMHLMSALDGGIYEALNLGIARASGDVIGFLHSDDFFAHEEVLSRVAECFNRSGADAVYGDLDYVSAVDPAQVVRRWRSGTFSPTRLKWGWMPPHPALFIRRAVYLNYGAFDTSFRIAADYDAILRYFSGGSLKVDYLPEVLVKMRLGGESNRSLERIVRKSREDYRALRKNHVGGISSLAWKNLSKLHQFIPAF